MPYRVLIADDDPYIDLTFSSLFRRQPWEVEVVEQGEEAIRRLTVRSIDIAKGNCAMYFPEVNVILSTKVDGESFTPLFKGELVQVIG